MVLKFKKNGDNIEGGIIAVSFLDSISFESMDVSFEHLDAPFLHPDASFLHPDTSFLHPDASFGRPDERVCQQYSFLLDSCISQT